MMRPGQRRAVAAASALLLAVLPFTAGCETGSMMREKGEAAMYRGDHEQAAHHYARAVEHRPIDYVAHFELGRAHLELDQPGQAQRAFEQAWTLRREDPEWTPRILDHIAEAIHRQDRPERLHAFLEQAVREYGGVRDHLRQAEYMVKNGDLDSARVAYRKAAYFAAPGDVRPYTALADFYESVSDQPKAVQALRWAHYVDLQDAEVAERLRGYNIVPGPRAAEAPPKPELGRR